MLLLLTIALVLVGAVALVIGFVNDAMFPIYLSIACSLLAAVVLVVFSRLSKARLEPAGAPAAIVDEPTGPLLVGRETTRDADFPIPDYEERRVAEIVPLLSDLDRDELELVRAHEAEGRNRTTVIRRIDDLIAESDGAAVDEEEPAEEDEALVGAAASFGRDEQDDLDEDFDEADEEDADVEPDLFPIADYDELSVEEILPLLDELTLDELEEVGDREADGQNRAAILDRVDQLLDEGEAAEAAAPKKAAATKAAPQKATAKKAATKKATAKKATTKKAPAKKAAATGTKSTAKKAAASKKASAKKSPAKKSAATKKATGSKSAAKKAPAKRAR